jgi:hypothetical protein
MLHSHKPGLAVMDTSMPLAQHKCLVDCLSRPLPQLDQQLGWLPLHSSGPAVGLLAGKVGRLICTHKEGVSIGRVLSMSEEGTVGCKKGVSIGRWVLSKEGFCTAGTVGERAGYRHTMQVEWGRVGRSGTTQEGCNCQKRHGCRGSVDCLKRMCLGHV